MEESETAGTEYRDSNSVVEQEVLGRLLQHEEQRKGLLRYRQGVAEAGT